MSGETRVEEINRECCDSGLKTLRRGSTLFPPESRVLPLETETCAKRSTATCSSLSYVAGIYAGQRGRSVNVRLSEYHQDLSTSVSSHLAIHCRDRSCIPRLEKCTAKDTETKTRWRNFRRSRNSMAWRWLCQ